MKELAATDWAGAWPATRSVPDRQGGAITMPGRPWHFSLDGAVSEMQLPALQGEHNDEVLRELGYHADEIAELRVQNALVQPGRAAPAARQESRAEVELVGSPPGVVA
jgi:crotonobetainyl-CoA:carnitine CoA-transferase CaiB-like acyl-CoA transferase